MLSAGEFFHFEMEFCRPRRRCAAEAVFSCFERLGERELVDPGVGACRGSSEGVGQGFWTRQSFIDPCVDARRGIR